MFAFRSTLTQPSRVISPCLVMWEKRPHLGIEGKKRNPSIPSHVLNGHNSHTDIPSLKMQGGAPPASQFVRLKYYPFNHQSRSLGGLVSSSKGERKKLQRHVGEVKDVLPCLACNDGDAEGEDDRMERSIYEAMETLPRLENDSVVRANIDASSLLETNSPTPFETIPIQDEGLCLVAFPLSFLFTLGSFLVRPVMQAMLITHMRDNSWSRDDPGQTAADPCFLVALVRIKCNSSMYGVLHTE